MAGHGPAGRQGVRRILRDAVSLAGKLSEAAGDQPRRARRAAGADRTGGAAGALAIRCLCLAGRRRAAEARQSDRRHRAERPAGLRDRLQGRAGLVRRCGDEKDIRPRHGAARLRSAAQTGRATVVRAAGAARCARPGARLAAGGAGAQAAEARQSADPDPGRGSVLSRRLRSRDRGLSRAGRRAATNSSGFPTSASAATAT